MADRKIKTLLGSKDDKQIEKAFELAKAAHLGQKRKSGEAFIEHPLAVAKILKEEGMSSTTIAAGLLHDTLEDTDLTYDTLKKEFGEEIANLVEGITKVERATAKQGQTDTYKKMLLAASDDARVLLIKMADRIHNLRTIEALPKKKQKFVAEETLEVYAPLAHRLGLSKIKNELEDRSLKIIDAKAWKEAGLVQEERKAASEKQTKSLLRTLRKELKAAGIQDLKATARSKSRFSIAEKLKRRAPSEIWDIVGLRIIVPTVHDCYLALGVVHSIWPPLGAHFDDYIAVPRSNLYQSLHTTVMTPGGRPVEIQIRTPEMDELAERGIGAHWIYKESLREGGPQSTKDYIKKAAASGETIEELFSDLRSDVFKEESYFFTPKGDVVLLPKNSTAIDFAYAIHSEIGHTLAGVKVDGNMKSITEPLPAGSMIEILNKKNGTPSRSWLEVVQTSKARSRIRSFFADELDEERNEEGLERIAQALRSQGLEPLSERSALVKALKEIGYEEPEDAGRLALKNKSEVKKIIRSISQKYSSPRVAEKIPEKKTRPLESDGGVRIEGMQGVMTRIAGCCKPEPGDDVIGYVSLGRGISVHKKDCRSVGEWKTRAPERLIHAEWEGEVAGWSAEIALRFLDRPGLLGEIVQTVYDLGAEIEGIESKTDGRIARCRLLVRLGETEAGEILRESFAEIEGCLEVARA